MYFVIKLHYFRHIKGNAILFLLRFELTTTTAMLLLEGFKWYSNTHFLIFQEWETLQLEVRLKACIRSIYWLLIIWF